MGISEPSGVIKGYCPACNGERNSDVVAEYEHRLDDKLEGIFSLTLYRILRYRGCDEPYVQKDRIFSEDQACRVNPVTGMQELFLPHDISYWPSPTKRTSPEWLPELKSVDRDLYSLCNEVYAALNADIPVLAAIGVRTVFDRASELLDIDPDKSFREKINNLNERGRISAQEMKTLEILTDAGSAAAHRGWRPKPEELDAMMSIIEEFLVRVFELNAKAQRLKDNVPKRKAR